MTADRPRSVLREAGRIPPESVCRWCGEPLPPKKPIGRPPEFCSRQHRRQWHAAKERMERKVEEREARIEEAYAREWNWHGKRQADREARRRRKELEARAAEWEWDLWTPGGAA